MTTFYEEEYNDYLDTQFTNNVHHLDSLKQGIDTNEQIIYLNKYESNLMDRKIAALFYVILYFAFFFIVLILTHFQVITPTTFIIYLIISTTLILWKIYTIYYSEEARALQAKLEATVDKLKESSDDLPKTCPWNCPDAPLSGFIPVPPPPGQTIVQHELSKDYSTNKWLNGDGSDYGSISEKYATTYRCEWNLGPTGAGRKSMPAQFTSTIPCENYPGYQQV